MENSFFKDIEEFTDKELIKETEVCIREVQNRGLKIPQVIETEEEKAERFNNGLVSEEELN